MRRLALLALAATLFASEAAAADFVRLDTEAAFRAHVADGVLVDAFGATLLFASNGGVGGTRGRVAVSGGWTWAGDPICRRIRLDTGADCPHLWIGGDEVVFRADRGRGGDAILRRATRRARR